jgi:hypothetical protein
MVEPAEQLVAETAVKIERLKRPSVEPGRMTAAGQRPARGFQGIDDRLAIGGSAREAGPPVAPNGA